MEHVADGDPANVPATILAANNSNAWSRHKQNKRLSRPAGKEVTRSCASQSPEFAILRTWLAMSGPEPVNCTKDGTREGSSAFHHRNLCGTVLAAGVVQCGYMVEIDLDRMGVSRINVL